MRAKLSPLCLERSWRDRLERKETKCERCDFLHLRGNNRSIYRKRTSAHFCFDKSHKLFSTCTFNKQKGRRGGGVSVCVNFHMPEPRKSPNESPCCLQHHHPKEEVTEAGNKEPVQGCCSTSFIINSLLYWLCIHLEGKRRRTDVWGSYISQHFPSSPVSYLAGCWGAGRMQGEPPATLIQASERRLWGKIQTWKRARQCGKKEELDQRWARYCPSRVTCNALL